MKIRSAIMACLGFSVAATAQLSPPGMGETKEAYWSAIGLNQKLTEKDNSITYVGVGRISGIQEDGVMNKPSIFVVNEEVYHKLSTHLKYSGALSYRRQHEYDAGPGIAGTDEIKQEFRVYGRLQYGLEIASVKWNNTLREEARKFYADDFSDVENGFQLRTRLKTQVVIPLDHESHNTILWSAEALFSAASDSHHGWDGMGYKESRFCLYYSLSPANIPVTFDIGYMNDLMGHGSQMADANYLAMDIIVKDLF